MGDDEFAKLQQERNRLQAEIRRIDLAIAAKQKPNRVRHEVEMSRSNDGVFALDVGKLDTEKLNASLNYQLDPAPPNTFRRTYTGSWHGAYRSERVAIRDINQGAREQQSRSGSRKAAKWTAYFPDLNQKASKTFSRRKDAVARLVRRQAGGGAALCAPAASNSTNVGGEDRA
jgi:hypothetical protein